MTSPGVHAFLIIVRVDRFTPEEKNTVDFIKKIFGDGAAKYCIVVFTREDQLEEGQTIDDFINSSDQLKELVQCCGNHKFAINNKLNGQPLKIKIDQLLRMIDQMVQSNRGKYYTNDMYQKIERQRKREQARQEEEDRKKKKAYEESLISTGREIGRQEAEERERERQKEQKSREKEPQKTEKPEKEQYSTREKICGCSCHKYPGVIHVVPCCSGTKFPFSLLGP
ncbi:unnamed protein product [Rotaria sordida]|uniref:AIG1-type G domain-containing protein n=1 Tax=Rotaria sordida TaxID=392033 RepID=A0A813S7B2_9BILA|nr:unnamed protein product [Rotaria sordida]